MGTMGDSFVHERPQALLRASMAKAQSWQQVQIRRKFAPFLASLPKISSAFGKVTYCPSPMKARFWPMAKKGLPSVNSRNRGSSRPARRKPLPADATHSNVTGADESRRADP